MSIPLLIGFTIFDVIDALILLPASTLDFT